MEHGVVIVGYLDPGSGSIAVQVLLGALAAGGVAITLAWQHIRSFLGGLMKRKPSSSTDVKP